MDKRILSRHIRSAPPAILTMYERLIHDDKLDGRKCLKCGSTTTYVTKKTGAKRWIKHENGWQCYNCYTGDWLRQSRMNGRTIRFDTEMDASRAAGMFDWVRRYCNNDGGGDITKSFNIPYYRYLELLRNTDNIHFQVIRD